MSRKKSFSSFGKSTFERELESHEEDVEAILKQIQTMEVQKNKTDFHVPDVVDRLLNDNSSPSRTRTKSKSHHKKHRKSREIREVHKIISPLDAVPSSAHYAPNFDAVLTNAPQLKIAQSFISPKKKLDLDSCTMNEMINQWSAGIRNVSFSKQTSREPTPSDSRSTFSSRMSHQSSIAELPPIQKQPTLGIISLGGNRDSYINAEITPSPTEYQAITPIAKPAKALSFEGQASRPQNTRQDYIMRDVGKNIDAIKKRPPRIIPFDKQSSRTPRKAQEDDIWKDIEEEQKRIINDLFKQPEPAPKREKKKESFTLQTGQVKHPFQHIMRKEVNPQVEYEPIQSLRSLDRPVTSFNIKQPALKKDRMVYRKSEAPDIIYDNVNEEWKNTQKRATTPIPINKEMVRRDPYHYMPHGCGQGKFPEPKSALTNRTTVLYDRQSDRKCLLDSPLNLLRPITPSAAEQLPTTTK